MPWPPTNASTSRTLRRRKGNIGTTEWIAQTTDSAGGSHRKDFTYRKARRRQRKKPCPLLWHHRQRRCVRKTLKPRVRQLRVRKPRARKRHPMPLRIQRQRLLPHLGPSLQGCRTCPPPCSLRRNRSRSKTCK